MSDSSPEKTTSSASRTPLMAGGAPHISKHPDANDPQTLSHAIKTMYDPVPDIAWLESNDGSRQSIATSCSFGRSDSNQIVIAESKVSRRHAIVHAQGEREYWLVDLGSSNGTYLNGRRVSQPTRLQNRDRIHIGEVSFLFRQPGTEPSLQTIMEITVQEIKTAPCWLLLADLIGSTAMSRKLSPEQLSITTGTWLARCKELIDQNGGSINKFLGDGFFAYWPVGENEQLSVADALADLKELQAQANPIFRIVLHRGDVAMGGAASLGEESLAGQEVNFVFRMEKLAANLQQQCLMSAAAREKLPLSLTASFAGQHDLPGFSEKTGFYSF